MKFKLVDTGLRETSKFPALVKVSPDGNLAYVVYEIEATEGSDLVAELFDISNNKLETIAVYVPEKINYPSVSSGFANSDFTLFSIIESNNIDSFRVRILKKGVNNYSHMLTIISETIITVDVKGCTSLGGTFLLDDKNIVVTAVTGHSNDNHVSKIWVLQVSDLKIISSKDVKGIVVTNPVALKDKDGILGFAICKSKGVLDFNNLITNWKPKHKVIVYKYKDSLILKMDEEELPQGALSLESYYSKKDNDYQLIVGTNIAILRNEPSVKVKSDELLSSAGTDGKELRIYNLKNWILSLKVSRGCNNSVENAYITPNGEHLIVTHKVGNGSSVLQVTNANKCNLKSMSVGIPLNICVNVSSDKMSTKMLIGTANDKNYINNNLLLYLINS